MLDKTNIFGGFTAPDRHKSRLLTAPAEIYTQHSANVGYKTARTACGAVFARLSTKTKQTRRFAPENPDNNRPADTRKS
jgi:hypothetical protein